MTTQISENQLISLVHRHIHLVGWIAFVVFNNLLITITLLFFWLLDLDSSTFYDYIQNLSQNLHLQKLWQVLSFWGLSGFVVASAYAFLWRKLYMLISLKYLLKNIEKQKIV